MLSASGLIREDSKGVVIGEEELVKRKDKLKAGIVFKVDMIFKL